MLPVDRENTAGIPRVYSGGLLLEWFFSKNGHSHASEGASRAANSRFFTHFFRGASILHIPVVCTMELVWCAVLAFQSDNIKEFENK